MTITITRRAALFAAANVAMRRRNASSRQAASPSNWSLPIRHADGIPGDGFLIRHGFTTEYTWFQPGLWHTGEDWYRSDNRETAGAEVLAVSAGEVTWIGSDYPGRVIFIKHADDLYSMYGHIEFDVRVSAGDTVDAGDVLGRVVSDDDWRAPNHLHFEMRDFFFNPIVNGDSPKYRWACGSQCPPGPGYWPIDDSQLPVELGWQNPMHVIQGGLAGTVPFEAQVATVADGLETVLRATPESNGTVLDELVLEAGGGYFVEDVSVGEHITTEMSAVAYDVWYRVMLDSGSTGWLPALIADDNDTGSDGRPSSVRPILLPAND